MHSYSTSRSDFRSRFWANVEKTDTCWLWRGTRSPKGYGDLMIKSNGKWQPRRAHRISWELHYGPIPTGMFCCHHCDTPGCVNPEHLFLGTPKDNTSDMIQKGRRVSAVPKGEANVNARLTDDKVREIRQRFQAGESQRTLAQLMGVTKSCIRDAIRGKTWKHI